MKPVPEPALAWSATSVHRLKFVLIATALVTTLSGTLGWMSLHFVCKPATMLLAILLALVRARQAGSVERFELLLIAALAASLAGDVFLMLPGNYFIPGLASFLIAHLFYLALFRHGLPWFPSRRALIGTLAAGAAMYTWVWGGLTEPVLKVAVAAYVSVISLMVGQAIGRAKVLGDSDSKTVALGACLFMLSDSLIAINRFVQALPLVSLWVLTSYYVAQLLMVHGARR